MNKWRYPAAICLVIIAAGILYWLKSGRSGTGVLSQPAVIPHVYEEPGVEIRNIKLKVFYAVPKNDRGGIAKDWKKQVEPVLQEVTDFHRVQFHYASEIGVEIYPEPVILNRDYLYYDTEDTDFGNPEGLRRIVPELNERFSDFLKPEEESYQVVAVVYEGVGAAGTKGSMILSRTYLSDPGYKNSRSALFYHEFAHTLGVPDKYEIVSGQPFSNDIMGRGRFRQISTNYLDLESIKEMGL